MYVKGKIEYAHLPYGELGGLTWCQFCKKTMERAEIGLHTGISSEWIEMRCVHCKKTVWVTELQDKKIQKLDKKCVVCKKKVGEYNCYCVSYKSNKRTKLVAYYYCSRKCEQKKYKSKK